MNDKTKSILNPFRQGNTISIKNDLDHEELKELFRLEHEARANAPNKHHQTQHRARERLLSLNMAIRWMYDLMETIHADSDKAWPGYIYAPLSTVFPRVPEALRQYAGEYAVRDTFSGGHAKAVGLVLASMTMATWRMTQGIYRFDEEVYGALIDTPLTGDIPTEVLTRLPEWCVYIETPGLLLPPNKMGIQYPMHGAWARLDMDLHHQILLIVTADSDIEPEFPYYSQSIPLGVGSISTALKSIINHDPQYAEDEAIAMLANWFAPIINLLLFICADDDFMHKGQAGMPMNPVLKKTKKGMRMFAAGGPTAWDVGVRMGSVLRAARAIAHPAGGEDKASPTPHVRRAHWHTFLTGKRDNPRREIRWLPPIPVGVKNLDELVATIRSVQPGSRT